MAARCTHYTVSDVIGLLEGEDLDDFGLAESEDSDCDDGEVGSYLPDLSLPSGGPDMTRSFTEEEAFVLSTAPGSGEKLAYYS